MIFALRHMCMCCCRSCSVFRRRSIDTIACSPDPTEDATPSAITSLTLAALRERGRKSRGHSRPHRTCLVDLACGQRRSRSGLGRHADDAGRRHRHRFRADRACGCRSSVRRRRPSGASLFALPLIAAVIYAQGGKLGRPSIMSLVAGVFFGLDIAFWHASLVMTSVANATFIVNLGNAAVGTCRLDRAQGAAREDLAVRARQSRCSARSCCRAAPRAQTQGALAGDLLALLAAVMVGLYLFFAKLARRTESAMQVLFWSTAATLVVSGCRLRRSQRGAHPARAVLVHCPARPRGHRPRARPGTDRRRRRPDAGCPRRRPAADPARCRGAGRLAPVRRNADPRPACRRGAGPCRRMACRTSVDGQGLPRYSIAGGNDCLQAIARQNGMPDQYASRTIEPRTRATAGNRRSVAALAGRLHPASCRPRLARRGRQPTIRRSPRSASPATSST